MLVVSDTSPIANLILIDQLELLGQIFTEVIVPTAVDKEIKALKNFGRDLSKYKFADWIKVKVPSEKDKTEQLKGYLDDGEAEAISLAIELKCELILIDERLGSKIAHQEGLNTIGLLGILIKAKKLGLIKELKPVLIELREEAGFWIGDKLQSRILIENNELP